jgi:hypothetical protein
VPISLSDWFVLSASCYLLMYVSQFGFFHSQVDRNKLSDQVQILRCDVDQLQSSQFPALIDRVVAEPFFLSGMTRSLFFIVASFKHCWLQLTCHGIIFIFGLPSTHCEAVVC